MTTATTDRRLVWHVRAIVGVAYFGYRTSTTQSGGTDTALEELRTACARDDLGDGDMLVGLVVTSLVQVYVSKERIAAVLGDDDLGGVTLSAVLAVIVHLTLPENLFEEVREELNQRDHAGGVAYQFCSSACKRAFEQTPDEYDTVDPVISGDHDPLLRDP